MPPARHHHERRRRPHTERRSTPVPPHRLHSVPRESARSALRAADRLYVCVTDVTIVADGAAGGRPVTIESPHQPSRKAPAAMPSSPTAGLSRRPLMEVFAQVPDPRDPRGVRHHWRHRSPWPRRRCWRGRDPAGGRRVDPGRTPARVRAAQSAGSSAVHTETGTCCPVSEWPPRRLSSQDQFEIVPVLRVGRLRCAVMPCSGRWLGLSGCGWCPVVVRQARGPMRSDRGWVE